jgi:hypothetical protein
MTMHDNRQRSDLTPEERELVGTAGDLVSEAEVPPRDRSSTVMLSLRLDRDVFDGLGRAAESRGRTVSETAREALRRFVWDLSAGDRYPSRDESVPSVIRKVSETASIAWDTDALQDALERYEAAARRAGMREKAWRSYVDYARRFLDWRTGHYQPRGAALSGVVNRSGPASTLDLREQAKQYAAEVEAARRHPSTVDTYFRHAMFFIRWLEGDFEPGRRLRGLS